MTIKSMLQAPLCGKTQLAERLLLCWLIAGTPKAPTNEKPPEEIPAAEI